MEGTDLFVVRAHLPVVESLGFGSELLSKTSGAATAPLLRFSHWSSLPVHVSVLTLQLTKMKTSRQQWLSALFLPRTFSWCSSFSTFIARTMASHSHIASSQVDPFWRPTSEDERDEHGEAYASHEAGLRSFFVTKEKEPPITPLFFSSQ